MAIHYNQQNISLSTEILDENDHCPQLRIESSFIMINRDITQRLFLRLIASDNDQGSNGQIIFELTSSTSPSLIYFYSNGILFMQRDSSFINNDSLIFLHVQM